MNRTDTEDINEVRRGLYNDSSNTEERRMPQTLRSKENRCRSKETATGQGKAIKHVGDDDFNEDIGKELIEIVRRKRGRPGGRGKTMQNIS